MEIWSVPIEGGSNVQINTGQPAGLDIRFFEISPDGSSVVYPFSQDEGSVPFTPRLYKASINGGAPLVDLLSSATDVESVNRVAFSSDGQYVVYEIYTLSAFYSAINSVPINGGTTQRLSGVPTGDGGAFRFSISEDNSTVFYYFGDDFVTRNRFFSTPINGGVPIELVNTQSNPIRQSSFLPDRNQLLYISENTMTGVQNLLLKNLGDPAAAVVLVPDLPSSESVFSLVLSPNRGERGTFDHD